MLRGTGAGQYPGIVGHHHLVASPAAQPIQLYFVVGRLVSVQPEPINAGNAASISASFNVVLLEPIHPESADGLHVPVKSLWNWVLSHHFGKS